MQNNSINVPNVEIQAQNPIKNALEQLKKTYNSNSLVQAIAMELNISERTLYNYINDVKKMPADKFIKLCVLLQLSPDELLNTENYNPDIKIIIDNYLLSLD